MQQGVSVTQLKQLLILLKCQELAVEKPFPILNYVFALKVKVISAPVQTILFCTQHKLVWTAGLLPKVGNKDASIKECKCGQERGTFETYRENVL